MERFCSKENNTSIGISWREENTSKPDTLLHPGCFLLTECISLFLPGCVRIVRVGHCRLLCDAGRGKNRFWIWLKSPSQTSYSRCANGNAPDFCLLSVDFQSLETRFWAVSMLDANVCKRGCKRLQPGMQTFATRDASMCVPEDNRLSASENAFVSSYFDVRWGTWQSHPKGYSGLKRASEDLLERIRRGRKGPEWMDFLHKTGLMCNDFLWMEERNRRMGRVILLM